jgi:ribosomal protein S18 acetylase RimI-like enzyme
MTTNEQAQAPAGPVTVRNDLRPGDVGAIIRMHGVCYAREYGFDVTHEAYVAGPLGQFVMNPNPRSRIWIAELEGTDGSRMVGCIAIVEVSAEEAQLRWFIVEPEARGHGLGRRLLREAVQFCREAGYRSVFLLTVDKLTAAARLYQGIGFRLTHEEAGRWWGVEMVEQRYELAL